MEGVEGPVFGTCDDFQLLKEHNLWVPRLCKAAVYVTPDVLDDFSESPQRVTKVTLDEVSLQKPDRDSFAIAYREAGSMVLDRSTKASQDEPGGTATTTVPASADDLRNAAKRAREGSGWRVSTIVIAANAVLLVVVALFFTLKKYKG